FQSCMQKFTNFGVLIDKLFIILFVCKPSGSPAKYGTDSKPFWINFLSHMFLENSKCSNSKFQKNYLVFDVCYLSPFSSVNTTLTCVMRFLYPCACPRDTA